MPRIRVTPEFLESEPMLYAIQQGYSFNNEFILNGISIFDISGPNLEQFHDDEFIEMVFIIKNEYGFSWDIKIKKAK